VKYVEIRCSPYKYTKKGLSEAEVVNAVMEVFDRYQDKIQYRLICIIGREAGIKGISKMRDSILNLLTENQRFADKMAGIDLAGNEGKAEPKDLREIFMPFLEKCIHITIHAGETEPVKNVWQAVYHLSADRIGHGLTLLDKPDLMRRFIDKNIGVELCPSSNDQIVGYSNNPEKEYPLKQYMEAGLKVTINTDNAGISRTSCSQEFYKAARLCHGLSLWDCLVLIRNSLSVAFLDNQTKTALLHSFEDELYDWCIEHISAY
jgi:adenosine deaminase